MTRFWAPENYYFKTLIEQAGKPDPANLRGVDGVERIAATMPDGVTLKGYKLRAASRTVDPESGYLLVLPGNAQLCDRAVPYMNGLRAAGLDVYLYDYRGYGESRGEATVNKIIDDTRALLSQLDGRGYRHRYVYGISFGGFVLLNAIARPDVYDGLIIDSTPSSAGSAVIDKFQPVRRLPIDCQNFLLIHGERDTTVRTADMSLLLKVAGNCRAVLWLPPDLGHPFDPKRPISEINARMKRLEEFVISGIRR